MSARGRGRTRVRRQECATVGPGLVAGVGTTRHATVAVTRLT
ncbi:hypothetical protein [Streptomyces sp. NPDC088785]